MTKPLALLLAAALIALGAWFASAFLNEGVPGPMGVGARTVHAMGPAPGELVAVDARPNVPALARENIAGDASTAVEPGSLYLPTPRSSAGATPEEILKVRLVALDENGDALAEQSVTLGIKLFALGRGLTSIPPEDPTAEPVKGTSQTRETDADGRVRFLVSRKSFPDDRGQLTVTHRQEKRFLCLDDVILPPKTGASTTIDLGELRLLRPRDLYPSPMAIGTIVTHEGLPPGDILSGLEASIEPHDQSMRTLRMEGRGRSKPRTTRWPPDAMGEVVVEADGYFAAYAPESLVPGASLAWLKFTAQGLSTETLIEGRSTEELVVQLRDPTARRSRSGRRR